MSFGIDHRPLTFGEVIGCNTEKKILSAILASDKYDNGYLFTGSHGIGKTTLAQLFARSILCEHRATDGSPCNECPSCLQFLEERNTAYLEVDAANNGTKESVETILKSLDYESVSGKFIVLFDEAHDISTAGKDALLKILEKKAKYEGVIFMFCTTEAQKMPKTIRSRCLSLQLKNPTPTQIAEKLAVVATRECLDVESVEALLRIADAAAGHYRDAENMLKCVSYLGKVSMENVREALSFHDKEVFSLLNALPSDLKEALTALDSLISRTSVDSIYKTIVKMLVDAARSMVLGIEEGTEYGRNVASLASRYGNRLAPVLDYVLSKDKLGEAALLQSDVILLHYKFQRGDFGKKVTEKLTEFSAPEAGTAQTKAAGPVEKKGSALESLSPWEQLDKVASLKNQERATKKDDSVEETLSRRWGPPVDKAPVEAISRDIDLGRFDEVDKKSQANGGSRV